MNNFSTSLIQSINASRFKLLKEIGIVIFGLPLKSNNALIILSSWDLTFATSFCGASTYLSLSLTYATTPPLWVASMVSILSNMALNIWVNFDLQLLYFSLRPMLLFLLLLCVSCFFPLVQFSLSYFFPTIPFVGIVFEIIKVHYWEISKIKRIINCNPYKTVTYNWVMTKYEIDWFIMSLNDGIYTH